MEKTDKGRAGKKQVYALVALDRLGRPLDVQPASMEEADQQAIERLRARLLPSAPQGPDGGRRLSLVRRAA